MTRTLYKYIDKDGKELVSGIDFRERVDGTITDKEDNDVRFKYPWVFVKDRNPIEVIKA